MNQNQYLELLNKGVSNWNAWRKDNPNVIPNLSNLTLSETRAGLKDPNTKQKVLKLEGINFSQVDFSKSIMRGIKLKGADLTGCKFYRSDLRKADLSDSNLSNAKLNLTNLTLTNLNNANLTNVLFWETAMSRTNFFGVKGLETCKHGGPSLIDLSTVRRSKSIPISFLRGIGLSDPLIQVYTQSINRFCSVFISYSHKNESFVLKLWSDLQKKGVRCWYAPEDLDYGDKFRAKIEDAIQSFDRLIVVLSKESVDSGWVEDEVETAMEREYEEKQQLLIPIRIDDYVFDSNAAWSKKIKRTRHIGDFSGWENPQKYSKSLKKLIESLQDKNGIEQSA